jgi:UDP-glucose 4-epimerase
MKPTKVLITGSRGFIGTHLCRRLERNGAIVIVNNTIQLENDVDVNDMNQLAHFSEKEIDVIVHLAAKSSILDGLSKPYETFYTNVLGTLNVLELARLGKISKLFFLSTYVYGQPKYLPIDEDHSPNPHTPYNQSKLIGEYLCENYSKDFAINVVTLRPFSIYGPGSKPYSFVPSVIKQIKENRRVVLSGENTKRDLLFIDDFIDLMEYILDDFPDGYNLYNAGYGSSYSLKEVSELLAHLLQKKIDIIYDSQMRPNDIADMVADISKVSEKFKWKPRRSLEEGLDMCVKNST